MTRRRGEIIQTLAIGLLVFLPILANATLPAGERAPAIGLLVYAGASLLLASLALLLHVPRFVLLPLVLIGVVYASFVWGCGCDVSYHAISAIYETNSGEATEFLGTPIAKRSIVLLGVLLVASGWFLVRRLRAAWAERAVRIPRGAWLTVFVAAALALTGYRALGHEFGDVYPLKFVNRNLDYLREVVTIRRAYERLEYEYRGPAARTGPLALLIVLGESARSANWSLYGYDRETNPEVRRLLEERPETTFLFVPGLPAGRVTRVSVPSLLSVATAREFPRFYTMPTVLRIFRAAGAGTFVGSAQLPTGYYEGLPNLVFRDAEAEERVRGHDDLLLPVLSGFLADPRPVRLVVLQLQGSHLDYDQRYPPEFERFHGRGDLVDTYDDSLLYTDWLLAEIVGRLRALPYPAAMIYVSDHGENLDDSGDGNLSHGARALTPYEVQVPMLLAVNDAFRAEDPARTDRIGKAAKGPGHQDYVAHTLLGMAGLTDVRWYRAELDLGSAKYDPPTPWFAENIRESVPYPSLPEVHHLFPDSEPAGNR